MFGTATDDQLLAVDELRIGLVPWLAQAGCTFAKTMGDAFDELRGAAVPVVQPADHRYREHTAAITRLDLARDRRVSIEGQMRSSFVVVHEVRSKNSSEMLLVEDDDVVQALSLNRADQALHIRILPGRSPRRDNLFNTHV